MVILGYPGIPHSENQMIWWTDSAAAIETKANLWNHRCHPLPEFFWDHGFVVGFLGKSIYL